MAIAVWQCAFNSGQFHRAGLPEGAPPMGPMGPPGAPGGHGEPPRGLPRPGGTRGRGPGRFLENPVFGSPAVPRPTRQNCLKTASPASRTYLNRSGLLFWSRWVSAMPQEPPWRPIWVKSSCTSATRSAAIGSWRLPEVPQLVPGAYQKCSNWFLAPGVHPGSSFFRKPAWERNLGGGLSRTSRRSWRLVSTQAPLFSENPPV